jgi:hypothetical protein
MRCLVIRKWVVTQAIWAGFLAGTIGILGACSKPASGPRVANVETLIENTCQRRTDLGQFGVKVSTQFSFERRRIYIELKNTTEESVAVWPRFVVRHKVSCSETGFSLPETLPWSEGVEFLENRAVSIAPHSQITLVVSNPEIVSSHHCSKVMLSLQTKIHGKLTCDSLGSWVALTEKNDDDLVVKFRILA